MSNSTRARPACPGHGRLGGLLRNTAGSLSETSGCLRVSQLRTRLPNSGAPSSSPPPVAPPLLSSWSGQGLSSFLLRQDEGDVSGSCQLDAIDDTFTEYPQCPRRECRAREAVPSAMSDKPKSKKTRQGYRTQKKRENKRTHSPLSSSTWFSWNLVLRKKRREVRPMQQVP